MPIDSSEYNHFWIKCLQEHHNVVNFKLSSKVLATDFPNNFIKNLIKELIYFFKKIIKTVTITRLLLHNLM